MPFADGILIIRLLLLQTIAAGGGLCRGPSFRFHVKEEQMKILKMKLSDLKKPERNVRLHTDKQIREFTRSVTMFGQIRPIVIDENNVILAGNGLYDTLLAMGRDTAEVYQYRDLTENQKKKLMIADNKIFSLGIDNLDTLNSFLEELGGDLDIPGYDEDILRQMVSEADVVTERISEYGTLDDSEIQSIRAGAERREQNSANESAGGQPQEETQGSAQDNTATEGQGGDTTEIRQFIICPSCGERIWL